MFASHRSRVNKWRCVYPPCNLDLARWDHGRWSKEPSDALWEVSFECHLCLLVCVSEIVRLTAHNKSWVQFPMVRTDGGVRGPLDNPTHTHTYTHTRTGAESERWLVTGAHTQTYTRTPSMLMLFLVKCKKDLTPQRFTDEPAGLWLHVHPPVSAAMDTLHY